MAHLRSVFRERDSLNLATTAWFLITAVGQWVFLGYLLVVYGISAFHGNWEVWNTVFPRGHVPGDALNNGAVAFHLLPAVLVMGVGPVMLIPWVRRRVPAFHRWLGRVYIASTVAGALVGLALVWIRGATVGDRTQHVGITLDALLILVFAVHAVRHARAGRWAQHRRWALRLFLATSAVWFFRLAVAGWITFHKGPAGFDPVTFTGPFLSVLTFAQTLVPWAILEAYFHIENRRSGAARQVLAGLLLICTLLTGFCVWASVNRLWAPPMARVLRTI